MRPQNGNGDAGVASGVIAFLIAGVLFMASIVAVLVVTRDQATGDNIADAPDAAAFTIQADTLADLVFDSTGFLKDGSTADWAAAVADTSRTGRSADADNVARLGLLDADDPDLLDYKKFQNLRNAPFEQETGISSDCDNDASTAMTPGDCFVNYVEARKALGLDDAGLDFHLRAYPSLQSVGDILACQQALDPCRDPNLQVTYVGNIAPADEVIVHEDEAEPDWAALLGDPEVTCTADGDRKVFRLSTTVENNGAAPLLLRASFVADFVEGPAMTQNANGYIVPVLGSIEFAIEAPAYDDRTCTALSTIHVDIKDLGGVIYDFTETLDTTITVPAADESDKDLWLGAQDYFLTSESVLVSYYGNDINKDTARMEILDCDCRTLADLLSAPSVASIPAFEMKNNGGSKDFGMLPADIYTAVIVEGSNLDAPDVLRVTERILVVTTAPTQEFVVPEVDTDVSVYDPQQDATDEVAMLQHLIEKFCPTYWDEKELTPMDSYNGLPWDLDAWNDRCGFRASAPWASPPSSLSDHFGDVFPASERTLREELISRLTSNGRKDGTPIYDYVDVLVIGSGVEHSELSSENIKGPIETWVEGGGTIIVLGSEVGKNNNWLNPFLNSGTRSSGGGVSVPDPAHPVLHVPDELDYPNYENDGEVWEFHGSSNANERFTQVVSQGEDGEFEPILAVSKPGALRNDDTGTSGTVILTTWVAYDVYRGENDAAAFNEGLKFLNNLLMMGYGDLYLDYGPDIPDNTNVVPAVRIGQIQHPDFDDPIEITLITFVFRG